MALTRRLSLGNIADVRRDRAFNAGWEGTPFQPRTQGEEDSYNFGKQARHSFANQFPSAPRIILPVRARGHD
jgi:hypothetical protein